MPKAVIFSNGEITDYSFCKDKISPDDFIVCSDGAIRHLLKLGIEPDVFVGDFDSYNSEGEADISENCKIIKLNPEKDETDTHYACNIAIKEGFSKLVIFGALGGSRIDHMICNIHLLEYLHKKGTDAKIINEKNTISVFTGREEFVKTKKYISFIPLDSKVEIEYSVGLKYSLTGIILNRADSLGVSNEITGERASVAIKSGALLVIESDD